MYINPEKPQSGDKTVITLVGALFAVLIIVVVIVAAIHPASTAQPSDAEGGETVESTSPLTETDTDEAAVSSETVAAQTTEETTVSDETALTDESAETAAETQDSPASAVSGDAVETEAETTAAVQTTDTSGEDYSDVILAETDDMGEDYVNKIVFLGDSTTYGLRYYEMLKDGRDTTMVWTPVNGTLTLSYASVVKILYPETDEEITIVEAAALKKPEILVITLGVNGVSFMGEDSFKNEYTKLVTAIQQASPDTKIILQSIYPVASNYAQLDSINNTKIDAANEWIKAIARECGVKYLDTQSALRGDGGFMVDSYQNGDGIHLYQTGFNVVLTYIRHHGLTD